MLRGGYMIFSRSAPAQCRLSLIGVDYPRIHDLEELLALLAQRGATVSERFYGLIDFTDFAVQFRYATVEEEDEPVDRLAMIQQVTELMDYVKQLLVAIEEDIE
jgi:HEPN domain-containing protein